MIIDLWRVDVFRVKYVSVWAVFSNPQHYHAYDGHSGVFRERISDEIALCQKRLVTDFESRPDVKIKCCSIDDLLSLKPHDFIKPDVVLFLLESRNFEEGIHDPPLHEFEIKAFLKTQKIPYTGCDGLSLFSDYDKSLQYSLALSAGINVPMQSFISDYTDIKNMDWKHYPAFIKPCLHGDSIGIRKSSIVHDRKQMVAELQRQKDLFPHEPIVIQDYLEGNEYTIGVMGNWNSDSCHTLPIIQIGYDRSDDAVSVLTHDAKNAPNSSEYMQDYYHIAELQPDIEDQIQRGTLAIYRRLKCRGYARADWRLDKKGIPKFLEINALPDIMDDASSIVKMYRYKTGRTHSDFIFDIIKHGIDE